MPMFETYTFTLETLSPLRIGSGEKIDSRQYYHNHVNDDFILRLDQRKWTKLLNEKELIDTYTSAILSGTSLSEFINEYSQSITLNELRDAALYREPVYRLPKRFSSDKKPYLHLFQSDSEGNPYIPGSSLKGPIAAALFAAYYEEIFTETQRKRFQSAVEKITKETKGWRTIDNESKKALKKMLPSLSDREAGDGKRVIYLLRAIRVSDSDPIDRKQLAICEKADVYPLDDYAKKPTGIRVSENNPGILHESLIPGTKVTFRLSIDTGELQRFRKDMTAETCIEWIVDALNRFRCDQDDYYTQCFFPDGIRPDEVIADMDSDKQKYPNHFYFGAGVGWVNKTLTYPVFGNEDDMLEFVARFLDSQFSKNKSKHLPEIKRLYVAPHKLKCAYYKGNRYLMGHCAFFIKK